jgi:chromate transporter
MAHIGFFRAEFVKRRGWLDDAAYTDLVALCQFLPGPASSQIGFSVGLMRAGYWGGVAAWTGFTLPSAVLLVLFAYGAHALSGPFGAGLLHGLMLAAVAIVAQAVFGMARTLCPDPPRASIAVFAALLMVYAGASGTQIAVILSGACAGFLLCRSPATVPAAPLATGVSRRVAVASLALFTILLVGLPWYRSLCASQGVALLSAFYRSGALVFGGGHVVLPLLQDAFEAPGWVSNDVFLAGYGAAQAVPGPLFTFAAYLGAVVGPSPHGVTGALIGLFGIFLPGILILLGTLPFWDALRGRTDVQAAMRGINAAVVGLLGAALYSPLWTGSVHSGLDLAVALAGFTLLTVWRSPPVLVVISSAVASAFTLPILGT